MELSSVEGTVDIIWGPDLEVIELPPGEPINLLTNDIVVSAQELSNALEYIRKQKGDNHESKTHDR